MVSISSGSYLLTAITFFCQDYFFDREQLTEGRPPADRLCRVCSKIGHIAKECPRLIAKKERYYHLFSAKKKF